MTIFVDFSMDGHKADGSAGVERHIRPPLQAAITIPFTAMIGKRKVQGAVYISVSEFSEGISDSELAAIADAVVEQLEAREG